MAPWCHDGEHARSLLSNAKLMESILKVDICEDGIVGYAINVESDIGERTMISDDVFVDNSEVTTNTHIWRSCFGCNSDVRGNWGCRRNEEIS